jgi:hypothetical protein
MQSKRVQSMMNSFVAFRFTLALWLMTRRPALEHAVSLWERMAEGQVRGDLAAGAR